MRTPGIPGSPALRVATAMTIPLLCAPLLAAPPAAAAATVDSGKLERIIERGVKRQADIRVAVKCPNGVTWARGKIILCSMRASDGKKYRVQVKLGSQTTGKVRWKVVA